LENKLPAASLGLNLHKLFFSLWINKKRERYKIILGILLNLSPLIYFKYSKFILSSLGIGGNSIVNGLRSAVAILDTPHLHTLILGVSLLNMSLNLPSQANQIAFALQGFEGLKQLGINVQEKALSSVKSVSLPLGLVKNAFFNPKHPSFYQYKGFLFNLQQKLCKKGIPLAYEEILFDKNAIQSWYIEQKNLAKTQPVAAGNQQNGQDTTFKWENRKIYESLQEEGEVFQALRELKKLCAIKK